ncbi:MAG: hypothetical protein PHE50_03195, partial [Dehalococcoidales bacterium]|nr:hypothetical protein [Dehalococcoidales bacterium]
MAERGFQTELWTDPFIQGLPPEAKLLFIYLWTNKHCNQAGLYEVTLKTIAFDTGLPQASLPALLKQLEPKVAWYPEQNLIWVKNFLKRQCKSQSFLVAAAKCLKSIRTNGLVKEFIVYNQSLDLAPLCEDCGKIVIPPSQHGGTTIPNPDPVPDPGSIPGASKGSGNGRKGVVKGEGKTKKQPDPVIAEILTEMKLFLGYPDKTDKDPIPNYAKEGQFLKKMLGRHFTRNEILSCWKAKVQQRRGVFV